MKSPRLARLYGKPSRNEQAIADEYWIADSRVRKYHAVGRTTLGLRTTHRHVDVSALVREMRFDTGSVFGWGSLTVPQKIDMLATELLRRDREKRRIATRALGKIFSREIDYLSPSQWDERSRHEFPLDSDSLAMVILNPRVSVYRGA